MLLAQLRTWRPWVVRDLWFRGDGGTGGWGNKGTRSEMMALSSGAGGARLCRPHEVSEAMVKDYGIICSRPELHQPTLKRRAPSRITATVLEYWRSG
jgi:hypothetical protein